MPVRDYTRSNKIPTELFRGRRNRMTVQTLDGVTHQAFASFVADNTKEKNKQTVAHWATSYQPQVPPSDEYLTDTIPNTPKAYWILDCESRQTSTVLKIMSEDLDIFDLRPSTLVDLLREGGCDRGGQLQGKFRWATYNGSWRLIRAGGTAEQSFEVTTTYGGRQFNGKPKQGVCYADGSGVWYYLGQGVVPAGRLVIEGGHTVTTPPAWNRQERAPDYAFNLSKNQDVVHLAKLLKINCWQPWRYEQPELYHLSLSKSPNVALTVNQHNNLEFEWGQITFPIWVKRRYQQPDTHIRLGRKRRFRDQLLADFVANNSWTAEPQKIEACFVDYHSKASLPVTQPAKNAVELPLPCPFTASQLFDTVKSFPELLCRASQTDYSDKNVTAKIGDLTVEFVLPFFGETSALNITSCQLLPS